MAERHEIVQVTCPAKTPISTPVEVGVSFPPGEVREIHVHIPNGHASLTGMRIAVGHTVVIPRSTSGWITGDNRDKVYTPQNVPNSGAWSVFVYNTDIYSHYWTVEFAVDETDSLPSDTLALYRTHKPRDLLPVSRVGSLWVPPPLGGQ